MPADQHPPDTVVSMVVIGGQPSSSDPGWRVGIVHKRVGKVPAETLVRVAIVSFERYKVLSVFFMGASLMSPGGGLASPQMFLKN